LRRGSDQSQHGTTRTFHEPVHPPGEHTMLVLSRQRDESIIIGDNIVVTVVDVRGDKVRLGIDAPREVSVHRREIYEAIQRENKQAAQIRLDEARQIGKSNPDRP
jgi:carbon storage regulator